MTAKIIKIPTGKVKKNKELAKTQYKEMIHAIVSEFFYNGIEFDAKAQVKIVPALKVLESMIYEHHGLEHEHKSLLEQFVKEFSKGRRNEKN